MDIDPFSHVSLREHFEEVLKRDREAVQDGFREIREAVKLAREAKQGNQQGSRDTTSIIIAAISLLVALIALFRHP